ncbi:DUF4229 domain-containing protein [Streptacidiphilus melanogenes]|uniref:DUF4229 domain-containing protein n=1 Tax=Streptacidiphilus melanogenes TaxID=411235 RepID=UPI000694E8CD|nr:DUF4229 domain-containing protein [Streptacidiphilus melanogenes]
MTAKSHATLRYSAMRASIFLACFLLALVLAHVGVLPVTAGASGVFLLLIIAGVVSAPISFVVLSRQRDAMSEQITGGIERRRSDRRSMSGRIAAQNAAEDALDDAVRAEQK